jgi:hypothetical protein
MIAHSPKTNMNAPKAATTMLETRSTRAAVRIPSVS